MRPARRPARLTQTLEDCIQQHNLFLIHLGHSWLVMRVTGEDSAIGGAVLLSELVERLPPAAMINTIAKIESVEELQRWLKAGRLNADALIARLNKPLDRSGYEEVFGVRGVGA